jgi:hypothetical protein
MPYDQRIDDAYLEVDVAAYEEPVPGGTDRYMKCMTKTADELDLLENSMMVHTNQAIRRMSRLPSGFDPTELSQLRRSDTMTKRSITTGAGKRSKLTN